MIILKSQIMKKYLLIVISFLLQIISYNQIQAQEQLTNDDYARAVSFLWQNLNDRKVFNLNVIPNWFPDSTGFWYTVQDKNAILHSA